MKKITRVRGNHIDLWIPLKKITKTAQGTVEEDFDVSNATEVKVTISSGSLLRMEYRKGENLDITGNGSILHVTDNGELPLVSMTSR